MTWTLMCGLCMPHTCQVSKIPLKVTMNCWGRRQGGNFKGSESCGTNDLCRILQCDGLSRLSPMLQFFATNGFPCPLRRNPSDHYLRIVNKDFDEVYIFSDSIYYNAYMPKVKMLICPQCFSVNRVMWWNRK